MILSSSKNSLFQSLNRAYKRSDPTSSSMPFNTELAFQSLNRAYKRSDLYQQRLID